MARSQRRNCQLPSELAARMVKNWKPIGGKTAITLELDEGVVKARRETGEGWQTRINADQWRARKLNIQYQDAPSGGVGFCSGAAREARLR